MTKVFAWALNTIISIIIGFIGAIRMLVLIGREEPESLDDMCRMFKR